MKTSTIHNLSERISNQNKEITELLDLLAAKSQTHLKSVMNEWQAQYNNHKIQYLNYYCNRSDDVGGDDSCFDFYWLFTEKPQVDKQVFYFSPDTEPFGSGSFFTRQEQVELFKRQLKHENPNLVKFSYSHNLKVYSKTKKEFVTERFIELSAYEFASLEDYIGNWFIQQRKYLAGKRSVLTKLLQEQNKRYKKELINNRKLVSD